MSGTTLHPVVWSHAANPKKRRVEREVRNVAWLPGLASLWTSPWYQMPVAVVSAADVGAWPFTVGLLVKFAHFLGTSHLVLELCLRNLCLFGRRAGRPISLSAVPVGAGTESLPFCRFFGREGVF